MRIVSLIDSPDLGRLVLNAYRKKIRIFDDEIEEDLYGEEIAQVLQGKLDENLGWIYIVTNPVNLGVYKVGMTKKSVEARLKSLNTAGVLGEWILIKSYQVQDVYWLEAKIHRELRKRFQSVKELFVGSSTDIINAVEEVILS